MNEWIKQFIIDHSEELSDFLKSPSVFFCEARGSVVG
jgi:hypothetical protein